MKNDNGKQTYPHQAGTTDYDKNTESLDKGHMFPVSLALSEDDKKSTFTLTNAVPQTLNCNRGKWRIVEQDIKCKMDATCINSNKVIEGFVVTGATPSDDKMLNTVNIPSHLWSAFCCYNSKTNSWQAGAYLVDNIQDGCVSEILTLAELSKKLTPTGSVIFPQLNCPQHMKA